MEQVFGIARTNVTLLELQRGGSMPTQRQRITADEASVEMYCDQVTL